MVDQSLISSVVFNTSCKCLVRVDAVMERQHFSFKENGEMDYDEVMAEHELNDMGMVVHCVVLPLIIQLAVLGLYSSPSLCVYSLYVYMLVWVLCVCMRVWCSGHDADAARDQAPDSGQPRPALGRRCPSSALLAGVDAPAVCVASNMHPVVIIATI